MSADGSWQTAITGLESLRWHYLVRSLELAPESFISRLARSTLLSKTEARSPWGAYIQSRTESHKCESVCPRNLSNISRRVAACQPVVLTGFPPDFHIRELLPSQPRASVPTWFGNS